MPFIVIILFGILASSFALILELITVSLFSLSDQTLFSFIPFTISGVFSFKTLLLFLCGALIEESSKYIFLRQYARRFFIHTKPALKNSLLLGMLFGFGFALLETFFLLNTPIFTLLGIALVHIVTAVAFALVLFTSPNPSESKPKKWRFGALSVISTAILFHTFYNIVILAFF